MGATSSINTVKLSKTAPGDKIQLLNHMTPRITTSLDGDIVNRTCTKQELRILNEQFTTEERNVLNNRYLFYITIIMPNGDLTKNISRVLTDNAFLSSCLSDVRRNRLVRDDPNITKLFKLLRLRITSIHSDICIVGDLEYDDVKAVIRISSYPNNTKFSTISDVYQLKKYITTLSTPIINNIKHYIIVRYIEQYTRLYFMILDSDQTMVIIDNIDT